MATRCLIIGPITASALVSALPDIVEFKSGRDLSAWLGLTPGPRSTGGTERRAVRHSDGSRSGSHRISRMGNRYLRRLLYPGAIAQVSASCQRHAPEMAPGRARRRPAVEGLRPFSPQTVPRGLLKKLGHSVGRVLEGARMLAQIMGRWRPLRPIRRAQGLIRVDGLGAARVLAVRTCAVAKFGNVALLSGRRMAGTMCTRVRMVLHAGIGDQSRAARYQRPFFVVVRGEQCLAQAAAETDGT